MALWSSQQSGKKPRINLEEFKSEPALQPAQLFESPDLALYYHGYGDQPLMVARFTTMQKGVAYLKKRGFEVTRDGHYYHLSAESILSTSFFSFRRILGDVPTDPV